MHLVERAGEAIEVDGDAESRRARVARHAEGLGDPGDAPHVVALVFGGDDARALVPREGRVRGRLHQEREEHHGRARGPLGGEVVHARHQLQRLARGGARIVPRTVAKGTARRPEGHGDARVADGRARRRVKRRAPRHLRDAGLSDEASARSSHTGNGRPFSSESSAQRGQRAKKFTLKTHFKRNPKCFLETGCAPNRVARAPHRAMIMTHRASCFATSARTFARAPPLASAPLAHHVLPNHVQHLRQAHLAWLRHAHRAGARRRRRRGPVRLHTPERELRVHDPLRSSFGLR